MCGRGDGTGGLGAAHIYKPLSFLGISFKDALGISILIPSLCGRARKALIHLPRTSVHLSLPLLERERRAASDGRAPERRRASGEHGHISSPKGSPNLILNALDLKFREIEEILPKAVDSQATPKNNSQTNPKLNKSKNDIQKWLYLGPRTLSQNE